MHKSERKANQQLLNLLHIGNDGFQESIILLLPFIMVDISLTYSQVGVIGSGLRFLGILLALPVGILASKLGALRLLIVSVLLYGVGYLLIAVSNSAFNIFMAYFIAGLSFGAFHPVAFAIVSRITDTTNRGRIMGEFTAIGDIGRIGFTTLVTLIASSIGWEQTASVYGLAAFIFFIFLLIFTSKNLKQKFNIFEHQAEPSINYIYFLRERNFLLESIAVFFDAFASGSLFVFLPFLLISKSIDPVFLGGFTAIFFVGNILGKVLLGRLTDQIGHKKILIASEILMAVLIVLLVITNNLIGIAIVSVLLGAFTKGTLPILKSLVSNSIDHIKNYERGFGLSELISSIGFTLAPVVLGFLSQQISISAAFYAMAVVATLTIFPALIIKT